MLIATIEGLIFFAILLAPMAIILGIGYAMARREGKTK
jgi:hypothetical protein